MERIKLGRLTFDLLDLHWLIGLLEGEGYFAKGLPSNPNQPIIGIEMTDEDTIEQVSKMVNRKYCSRTRVDKRFTGTLKPLHTVRILGKDAIALMHYIQPFMSKRRQEQITKAINSYRGDFKNKLSDDDVRSIRKLHNFGQTNVQISEEFNVNPHYIYEIVSGKRRKNVR